MTVIIWLSAAGDDVDGVGLLVKLSVDNGLSVVVKLFDSELKESK